MISHWLFVESEHAEHSAKDLAVIDDDGIHGVILRLEADMPLLLVEGLDRSGVIDQSNNNLAVMCSTLRMYKDTIPIEDTGIDHGLSANIQDERFTLGYHIGGNREVVLNILLREDWLSGSYIADDREADHLSTYHLEAVVADLNGTGLGRVSADVAVLLQSLQMGMHGRSGLQIHRLTDLTDGRGIASLQNLIFNII